MLKYAAAFSLPKLAGPMANLYKLDPCPSLITGIWSFSILSFQTLFGIDLTTALVSQTFEEEVNQWKDINFIDTQFIFEGINFLDNSRILGPGYLEYHLIYLQKFHTKAKLVLSKERLKEFGNVIKLSVNDKMQAMKIFGMAQMTENPSDITFVMTRNTYILFGHALRRLSLDYYMRLSKKPINSITDYMWIVPKYSLLSESFTRAIHRIHVTRVGHRASFFFLQNSVHHTLIARDCQPF